MPVLTTVNIIKALSPTDDLGRFNLQLDGVTQLANAGSGAMTGAISVTPGSHLIGETGYGSTLLANYTTTIVATQYGVPIASGGNPLIVTVPAGVMIVCTITNTRNGPPPAYSRNTLILAKDQMEGRGGWLYDTYTPNVLIHYGEEGANQHSILCGGADGTIYQLTGNSDAGSAVACEVLTASRDQGDTRFNKLYGDIMLDCDTGGVAVTATPQFDNDSVAATAVTVNNAARAQVPVTIGTAWQTARNISLDLAWDMNGTRSYFYTWEPRFTEEGGKIYAYSWETCWLSHGLQGYFYHGWLYLVHISTADLTFNIINEDTTVTASVTVPNSGGNHNKTYVRLPIAKGKLFKYSLSSTAPFRVEGQESELLVRSWGMGDASHFRGMWVTGPWHHSKIFQDLPEGRAA